MTSQRFYRYPLLSTVLPFLRWLPGWSVTVSYGVCHDHLVHRRHTMLVCLVVIATGLALGGLAAYAEAELIYLFGAISLLSGFAGLMFAVPFVRAAGVEDRIVALTGVDWDFLCSLYYQMRMDSSASLQASVEDIPADGNKPATPPVEQARGGSPKGNQGY